MGSKFFDLEIIKDLGWVIKLTSTKGKAGDWMQNYPSLDICKIMLETAQRSKTGEVAFSGNLRVDRAKICRTGRVIFVAKVGTQYFLCDGEVKDIIRLEQAGVPDRVKDIQMPPWENEPATTWIVASNLKMGKLEDRNYRLYREDGSQGELLQSKITSGGRFPTCFVRL